MMDMTTTVAPKRDQMNADDLIGRTRTIKVTRVHIASGEDQPVSIFYEGDDGKPFKPCKSMRRVLINAWGGDGNAYAGRRMMLHRDDKVVFGGMAVGGIRISHMSDIARDITMALTDKRGSRKPYVVKPLPKEDAPASGGEKIDAAEVERLTLVGNEAAARGTDALRAFWGELVPTMKKTVGGQPQLAKWQAIAAQVVALPAPDPTDWDARLDDYARSLAEAETAEALDKVVSEQGAMFTDAPQDVQEQADRYESAERLRFKGASK